MLQNRVTNQIAVHTVLDYFDGPQIVEARDLIGGHYLGVRIPEGPAGDFLVLGVEPDRLKAFRNGELSLLDLIQTRPYGWYFGSLADEETSLVVRELMDQDIPEDCLPGPNYFL